MGLVLEVPGGKVPVERILPVLVVLEVLPGAVGALGGVVEAVVEVAGPVGVAQRLVLDRAARGLGQAEDVVASLRVAVHRERVRMVGRDEHEGLLDVHVLHGRHHGVVELGHLAQGQLRVVLVVGQIDLASLNLFVKKLFFTVFFKF